MNSEKINLVVVELIGFGGSFGLDLISRDFDDACLNSPNHEIGTDISIHPLKMLLKPQQGAITKIEDYPLKNAFKAHRIRKAVGIRHLAILSTKKPAFDFACRLESD